MKILLENISSPPEKMKMMFEAVSELIKEKKIQSPLRYQISPKKQALEKVLRMNIFLQKMN